jgi:cellulose binding protein with CBM2 domain
MAQHRKKPARRNECRRNQWWIRARRGPPSEPRHTRAAGAVRRVIVTPTFAAGLGVVVAALLAFQMGVPSFRVSVPRWTGQRCTTPGCQHQPGQSGPAAVPGGQPLTAPAPAASTSPGPGSADAASQSAPPVVSYQTDRSWPGGFRGHLTFSFTGRGAPGRWWLRFVYPSGRIQRVWGAVRWQPHGDHVAVVGAPRPAQPARRTVQVSFQVTGHAGRPSGCSFNHAACHFRSR